MPGIAACMEDPMVEIIPVVGGYIASVRVPFEDDDEDGWEIRPIISADLDLLLEQVKKYIIECQHQWRKNCWGDLPEKLPKPKSPVKK